MYAKYFNIKFPERDESWALHIICSACNLMLYKREECESSASMKFILPEIWKKPQNERDCYFCISNPKKWGIFNKKTIIYTEFYIFSISKKVTSRIEITNQKLISSEEHFLIFSSHILISI